jgi:uncharacterized membrane protein
MTLLILGLAVFLGVHSVRIFADGWRQRSVARLGEGAWKGIYSVLSIVGFALIVVGWGAARQQPLQLWVPPVWTHHLAGLLTLVAFVMLAAAYVPGNSIKTRLKHPMLLGVQLWAFAHLLANGTLAAVLLFGGFLVWAAVDHRSARRRDRAAGTVYPSGRGVPTVATVVVGFAAWAGFAMWAHGWLIGVRPFP